MEAGLYETLSGPGPFTVFAPDNQALASLPPDLGEDVEMLKKVLLFHVLNDSVLRDNITNDIMLTSVEGTDLMANVYLKSDYYDVSLGKVWL